ncbi:MAG: flavodoxin domain-containing protein [Bacillota bacterium]
MAYDTMWLSTEKMAHALLDGLAAGGYAARLFKLSVSDHSEIVKEILEAHAVLVGSPTINNGALPVVSSFLDELAGLRPGNKVGLTFGSYGWGGGALKVIEERLKAAKIELAAEPGPTVKWAPTPDDLRRCYDLGLEIAARIRD